MPLWTLITYFGDAGLMIPTALVICAWLYLVQSRAAAALWLALFAGAGLIVAATKIAFLGFGLGIHRVEFTGISGHAMMSMAVFPVAFLLLGGPATSNRRLLLFSLGGAVALLVAISRVAIDVHSPSEVASGAALGAGVAWLFVVTTKPLADRIRRLPILSLGFIAIVLAGYGRPAPSHDLVTKAALVLSGRQKPYTKQEWWAEGHRKARAHDI